MGFTKAELATFQDASVPDLVGEDPRLVFVGINPGLWTAAVQTHFARPGNRFYPALQLAGIIDRTIDTATGLTGDDRAYLLARGLGNTNLVNRATARADELTADELRAGRTRLEAFVAAHRPRVVAVAGVTAYRVAFGEPKARAGGRAAAGHRPGGSDRAAVGRAQPERAERARHRRDPGRRVRGARAGRRSAAPGVSAPVVRFTVCARMAGMSTRSLPCVR